MAVQHNLFPDPAEPVPPPPPAPSRRRDAPVWFQRVSLFILVIFCVYLGVIVVVVPWWNAVYDQNLLFLSHPKVWAVLRLGVVRGLISGVGLLDIWVGISEAIHYRDSPGDEFPGRAE